jgi:DNA-binding MarR family transcriptional regulator
VPAKPSRTKRRESELAQVADIVHGAAIRLLRFVRREDAGADLSAPQLSALSVLVFGGPQSMTALAGAEQVRAPTMSRLVDDLERRGLATRVAQPGDRRVKMVQVTASGRALLEAGRQRRLGRLVEVLGNTSQNELDTLRAAAETILRLTQSGTGSAHRTRPSNP